MKDVVVSITFSIESLFASEEMLISVAKIAYEWYCYSNGINCFISETYQDIVDCILMKLPVTEFVEIVVDGNLDYAQKVTIYLGSHGLFKYTDIDGYKYVINNFGGIIYYRIRIKETKQNGGLFPQEGAHVGDALFLIVPPGAFQLKLLLNLAQAVKQKNTPRLLIGLIAGTE